MKEAGDGSRLLIIGIDGASYPLVKEWVDEGKLPTFGKLMNTGSHGMLRSTTPPVTFPAIPSFMTGKNPGKHGVACFFRPHKDSALGLVSSSSVKDELWNNSAMKNKVKLLINLPLTYPAKPLKGYVITGMLTPNKNDKDFIYPYTLREKIKHILDQYIIDVVDFKYIPNREKEYLRVCEDVTEKRMRLSTHLLDSLDWDIAIIYFSILDRIQHNLFGKDENKWLLKGYRIMDRCLQDLLTYVNDRTNMFIFSDHGFGPSKGRFFPNAWLNECGYLHYVTDRKKARTSLVTKVRKLQFNKKFTSVTRIIPGFILQRGLRIIDSTGDTYNFESLDWTKTKLYATITGIYINPEFDKERETLLTEVEDKLKNLHEPVTGQPLKIDIFKKDELYNGKHMDELPDLLYRIEDYAYEPFPSFESIEPIQTFDHRYKGWHREEGLFLAYGPDIRDHEIQGAGIIDLAPTILHLFKCPIPTDMDGQVLKDIFKKESEAYLSDISYMPSTHTSEKDKLKRTIRGLRINENHNG